MFEVGTRVASSKVTGLFDRFIACGHCKVALQRQLQLEDLLVKQFNLRFCSDFQSGELNPH